MASMTYGFRAVLVSSVVLYLVAIGLLRVLAARRGPDVPGGVGETTVDGAAPVVPGPIEVTAGRARVRRAWARSR
jgi:hypothetical protein